MSAKVKTDHEKPLTGLVDEMLARYIDWREDAATAGDAYRRWREVGTGDEAQGYSAYIAALDQEESAAITYELAVWDVERWLQRAEERRGWPLQGPDTPRRGASVGPERARGADVRSNASPH